MKSWLITLPLLFAANLALAADPAPAPPAGPTKPAAQAQAAPKHKMRHHPRSLPHGDLRRCLDQKANKDVIRCSEKRGKR